MTSCRSTSTALLRSSAVTMKAWVNKKEILLYVRGKGGLAQYMDSAFFRGPAQWK